MFNNILIFRTDKIGDLLTTCPTIVTIKKYLKNSEITLISSKKNHAYAKSLNIFDKVYKFPNDNLFNKIKFIYKLAKKKFDYVFIYDTKDRSLISSIFISSKYKFAATSNKKFNYFCRLFNIKFLEANKDIAWDDIFQKSLYYCQINTKINNYDFLKKKKDNNFSLKISVNSYIHIHLDEKMAK